MAGQINDALQRPQVENMTMDIDRKLHLKKNKKTTFRWIKSASMNRAVLIERHGHFYPSTLMHFSLDNNPKVTKELHDQIRKTDHQNHPCIKNPVFDGDK